MNKKVKTNVLDLADKIQIDVGLSANIPTADFENMKPFYNIQSVFSKDNIGMDIDSLIDDTITVLKDKLSSKLDDDYNTAIRKKIEKTRGDIRFKVVDGKTYVHVTNILTPFGIDFDSYLLNQYASRGTIVHYIAEMFLIALIKGEEDPKEIDPTKVKELKDDVELVTKGSLGLSWKDCSFKGFWDKYGKDFDLSTAETEKMVFNDKYLYCGTMDFVGNYKGVRTVADWKTASSYDGEKKEKFFKQTAAYAKCVGAEQLMIVPLNPKNKQGFGTPYITDDVEGYFRKFIEEREKFRKYFGF